jgi:xylan 1,4-beta-xylosidase
VRISNPVVPGFHPDPSILRVGNEYYIANSTFEWYPGVEIHRSPDMITWESVPSPLSEKRLLDMEGAAASCGVWAPCLSYSNDLFWLIYTNVRSWNAGPWKDTPNYLTTAPSIEGPWSDPVFLNCSGFDPSLFHDDDGKKWFLNMEWDYRQATEVPQFTGILLQKYNHAEKKLEGPITKIFTGSAIGSVEGPHLYKKNGWYYLMTAEGGTVYEHAVTLGRSRSITGPYELHPHNPLLTSYGKPELRLQKAGHGSFCDTPDGRSYLAFLCGRPLAGTEHCVLGRETALVELEWHDDWPYVKPEPGQELFINGVVQNHPTGTFSPPCQTESANNQAEGRKEKPESRLYRFDGKTIPGDFKSPRSRDSGAYSLDARPGYLRLRGGQSPVSSFGQTLLARRQTDFSFTAETRLEFDPKSFQELAGLCWRYDEANQYLLALSLDEVSGRTLNVLSMKEGVFSRTKDTPVPRSGPIWLGLTVRERHGRFRYSLDGKKWVELRPVLDAAVLSDEYYRLGFTGAFTGIFCTDTARYEAVADFEYFLYSPED